MLQKPADLKQYSTKFHLKINITSILPSLLIDLNKNCMKLTNFWDYIAKIHAFIFYQILQCPQDNLYETNCGLGKCVYQILVLYPFSTHSLTHTHTSHTHTHSHTYTHTHTPAHTPIPTHTPAQLSWILKRNCILYVNLSICVPT